MALREKDQKNLEALLAFLETRKMRAELMGSAASGNPNYRDLDLNVWDAQEKGPGYKLGRGAMDNFLKDLGIKNVHFTPPVGATWCEGRWYFNYNGTKFDLIYTPWGQSCLGYAATETPEDAKKKSEK
ncbi:hypothetical protein J4449_02245 [Candidatus Woesearchaeota archaeon]|nr:hypothetical protein [Candidatus Woesearchaeota archaeon]